MAVKPLRHDCCAGLLGWDRLGLSVDGLPRASRFGSSTRVLCAVEFSIAVVNILICFLLSADISERISSFQRVALGLGIPIRWLYALGAFLVLFIPCFLMGTTIPLASEVCQRELGSKDPNVLNRLYALNTFGSVVGSLVGLAVLVPHFGQSKALLAAVALNCFAGVTLLFMPRKDGSALNGNLDLTDTRTASSLGSMHTNGGSAVVTLAFGFGFCALWYEMFLYRAIAMAYEPLPLVFSTVLTGYLVFWSLGVWASSRIKSNSNPSDPFLPVHYFRGGGTLFSFCRCRTGERSGLEGWLVVSTEEGAVFFPVLLLRPALWRNPEKGSSALGERCRPGSVPGTR